MGCYATKVLPVLSSWSFIGSSLWKGIGQISTYFCFDTFSIIKSSGEYNSTSLCTCVMYCLVLYILFLYFLCYIFVLYLRVWHFSVEFSFCICVLYFLCYISAFCIFVMHFSVVFLCYIFCVIFTRVEFSCYIFCVIFLCCIFHVVFLLLYCLNWICAILISCCILLTLLLFNFPFRVLLYLPWMFLGGTTRINITFLWFFCAYFETIWV